MSNDYLFKLLFFEKTIYNGNKKEEKQTGINNYNSPNKCYNTNSIPLVTTA